MKRCDRDPALAIESIERQNHGNKRSQTLRCDWPMCKQQIVPCLLHDPGTRSNWPGTMRNELKGTTQEISVSGNGAVRPSLAETEVPSKFEVCGISRDHPRTEPADRMTAW